MKPLKVAVIGTKYQGMNDLVISKLLSINTELDIISLDQTDLTSNTYDGLICLSTYDIEIFESMIPLNDYCKCNMMITGATFKNGSSLSGKNIKDFNRSILWRDKMDYKKALEEFNTLITI